MRDFERGLLGIGPPMPSQIYIPSHLELVGDEIHWWSWDQSKQNTPAPSTTGMLDAFLRIRDREGAFRFAQRYSPLGICSDGLPWLHNRGNFLQTEVERESACMPLGYEDGMCRDPVERYKELAGSLGALVRLIEKLRQGDRISNDDWLAAYENTPLESRNPGLIDFSFLIADPELSEPYWESADGRIERARNYVALLVQHWLVIADVRTNFVWYQDDPVFVIDAGSFGVLVSQIATAASGMHSLAACSLCGTVYERKARMPKHSQKNYCDLCVGKPADRARKAARRKRAARKEKV